MSSFRLVHPIRLGRIPCLLLVLLASPSLVAAQPLPEWAAPSSHAAAEPDLAPMGPMSNQGPVMPGPPAGAPVDGGLALLALAGAGYAARRLRSRKD